MYFSHTALVLLCDLSSVSAGSIWAFNIDESPAPPPAKGPPFSANAIRNTAVLPYEIIGVVGAYIASVLIIGSLLLTVGRNLRKQALSMAVEPREMAAGLPGGGRHWYSPRRVKEKPSAHESMRSAPSNYASPGGFSVGRFDVDVIEADRLQRQQEMEKLYAAVMEQDQERSAGRSEVTALPPMSPELPPEYSRRLPPKLNTTGPNSQHAESAYLTPKSPVRAIYPPGSLSPGPASPVRSSYQARHPAQLDMRINHSRGASHASSNTLVSAGSDTHLAQKKMRKSIRSLKISSPIIKPEHDNDDGARTPLSPRFYTDPGAPPEPPTPRAQPYQSYATEDATVDHNGEWHGYEDYIDEVRDLPQPYPQKVSAHNYSNPAQLVTNAASTRPDPTATAPARRTAAAGNGSLPFREMNRQYAQQTQQARQMAQSSSQTAAFPLSPNNWNPLSPSHAYATSAGPVKTTFLEARRDRLGTGPRTGVPTPYSPYMPFTPLTPVTPHLTSKAERKQRMKEDKKVRGVISEEDAVVEEKELWSSGY